MFATGKNVAIRIHEFAIDTLAVDLLELLLHLVYVLWLEL